MSAALDFRFASIASICSHGRICKAVYVSLRLERLLRLRLGSFCNHRVMIIQAACVEYE
jgi:hypothetical protein